ncbi:hypothetical protein CsSME_00042765 [Camellia sinensis var. sinensis]
MCMCICMTPNHGRTTAASPLFQKLIHLKQGDAVERKSIKCSWVDSLSFFIFSLFLILSLFLSFFLALISASSFFPDIYFNNFSSDFSSHKYPVARSNRPFFRF